MRNRSEDGGRGKDMKSEGEVNVDGGVRDADVYAIGDDDEDDEEDGVEEEDERRVPSDNPILSSSAGHEHTFASSSSSQIPSPTPRLEEPNDPLRQDTATRAVPAKYYIEPTDTLHSISLRFKLDVRPYLPYTASHPPTHSSFPLTYSPPSSAALTTSP